MYIIAVGFHEWHMLSPCQLPFNKYNILTSDKCFDNLSIIWSLATYKFYVLIHYLDFMDRLISMFSFTYKKKKKKNQSSHS